MTDTTVAAIEEIDLLDLDRWVADGVPHHWFDVLRREAPVWKHPGPDGGPGFWVLSRYDDVVTAGRHAELLSSDAERGGILDLVPPARSADEDAAAGVDRAETKSLMLMDPPEHTQYRKLVNKGFTPKMVARLEPRVRAITSGLLDRLADRPDFDFVEQLAVPLPLTMIAELLGVPEVDQPKVLEWTNAIATPAESQTDDPSGAVMSAYVEFSAYAAAMRADRIASPADDLVSDLVGKDLDGQELSAVRFNLFVILLAAAGNETTRNALSHGVVALSQHPDALDALRANPSLATPAVEEIVRYSSPVIFFRRTAVTDLELGGQSITEGDIVSLWYSSANRDEAVFDDPHRFDITRDPNPHIAFGGGGPHFCLGASLARLEIRVFLEELARRVSGIELTGPTERVRTNLLNGLKRVPVRFAWT